MMDERGEFLSEAIEHISNSVDPRVRDWYSEEQLVTNLRSSFAEELQRVDNLEFATGFAGVCPVDGAEPNNANFVQAYARGWQQDDDLWLPAPDPAAAR